MQIVMKPELPKLFLSYLHLVICSKILTELFFNSVLGLSR